MIEKIISSEHELSEYIKFFKGNSIFEIDNDKTFLEYPWVFYNSNILNSSRRLVLGVSKKLFYNSRINEGENQIKLAKNINFLSKVKEVDLIIMFRINRIIPIKNIEIIMRTLKNKLSSGGHFIFTIENNNNFNIYFTKLMKNLLEDIGFSLLENSKDFNHYSYNYQGTNDTSLLGIILYKNYSVEDLEFLKFRFKSSCIKIKKQKKTIFKCFDINKYNDSNLFSDAYNEVFLPNELIEKDSFTIMDIIKIFNINKYDAKDIINEMILSNLIIKI